MQLWRYAVRLIKQHSFQVTLKRGNTLSELFLKGKFHYASWFEAGRRQVRTS